MSRKRVSRVSRPSKSSIIDKRLLPLAVFCANLGCSYAWGRKQVQSRKIAYVKIGRKVCVPESEITRIISQNIVPPLAREAR